MTSNAGVPWSNVRVKVSSATVAAVIGGGPLTDLEEADGNVDEAGPDGVHVVAVAESSAVAWLGAETIGAAGSMPRACI
jgi:hypothetical protein